MYWDHDFGWAGWLVMSLGMLGFWIAVALVVLLAVRAVRRPEEQPREGEPDPRQILERRLAHGEIDVDEFQVRLEALGGSTTRGRQAATTPDGPVNPTT